MKITKYTISYFFFGLFLSLILYMSGIIKLFETIISLIIYSIFFYFIYYLWKSFRKKEKKGFDEYLKIFIYKATIFIYVMFFIVGGFAYYNNEISPAMMPEYTITNGDKIVVFQSMSHIAKQNFYNEVEKNIQKFKSNSGVYFYEGVKPGTKESSEKFDEALGINFTPDLYKHMSRLYGVTFQDNNRFLGLVNNLDFNVDLDLDQIIKIYEEKKINKKNKKDAENKQIINASEEILNKLNLLKDKELEVLIYINQAILNLVIKNDKEAKELLKDFGNQDLFSVILDERNDNLSKEIMSSKYSKIYITYGLLHFEGVFELLKKQDSNWKIVKTNYLYPIK
ncbi:hypothetical protein EOM39_07390 [Candidatus Gracilibacteria bacterium]|nr:hypothetical protein [Candidatus Gracilibacteria bacterium]